MYRQHQKLFGDRRSPSLDLPPYVFTSMMSRKRKRHEEPTKAAGEEQIVSAEPEEALNGDESSPKVLDDIQRVNIQKKIFHTIKETGRAFKKARAFEVRKIIKRLKSIE